MATISMKTKRRKKRIGIIALGYAWLPQEKGPSRFYYIANILAEAGYQVDLIGGTFQHFEKKRRNIEELKHNHYKFRNVFIPVPEYKKNIDIRRLWSNYRGAVNVIRYLNTHSEYDAIYCAIPANNIAAKVSLWCKKRKIPFVVDIEDLWPEAMRMVFQVPVISGLLYYPIRRDAEIAYKNAKAVIGTSEEYTNRAFWKQKREILAETVYVGCDIVQFDQGASPFLADIKKGEEEFWVSYAGSIATSYDIKTLIRTAVEIEAEKNFKIKFKVMGSGPMLEEMQLLVKKLHCKNVAMMGYMEYGKMAAYLKKSDVVINSFVKGAPQSIVNKIGDYLSSESAIINTLENIEFIQLVEKEKVGLNIEPENIKALKGAIIKLYQDRKLLRKLSRNARCCAETKFNRAVSYQKIVKVLERVMDEDAI